MRTFLSILTIYIPVVIFFKIIVEWPWVVLIMAFALIPFLLYQEHKKKTMS